MNNNSRATDTNNPHGGNGRRPGAAVKRYLADLSLWFRCMDFAYVQAEYAGGEGSGAFYPLRCYRGGRADYWTPSGGRTIQVTALFATLLNGRHPTWKAGEGSCGDFRWDLVNDRLIHTHIARGERNEEITHFDLDSLWSHESNDILAEITRESR